MSPILKRDIGEQYRQARRLAAVFTGGEAPHDPSSHHYHADSGTLYGEGSSGSYGSASGARRGGLDVDGEPPPDPRGIAWGGTVPTHANGKGKGRASQDCEASADEQPFLPGWPRGSGDDLDGDEAYDRRARGTNGDGDNAKLLPDGEAVQSERGRGLRIPIGGQMDVFDSGGGVNARAVTQWSDLRCLLFESTPSLLVSLIGLVFTGELLEHLARWRVFRRVDELFILVPMLGNLKGNLEMCLSARLGTSAAIGELDHRPTRRALLLANLTLLGLQALLISCLAAVISFVLGLLTVHRLGDAPPSGLDMGGATAANATAAAAAAAEALASGVIDPGLAVGEQEWHDGYTRPGWKQLVMVLATGMGAAGISSAVLGSFMGSMVVACRWSGIDPDNITSPVAACLGDLLTLFILALLGTGLVGTMDTPVPLVAVILMGAAAAWFTRRVMRNQWVKNVAKGGWLPLIGAMLISSGTGMALDKGVGKYRGFALLAISMTGLTGSIGGIHANRLSTRLHMGLHPASLDPKPAPGGLSPLSAASALFALAFPCQLAFLVFVNWAGWIDLDLGWAGWLAFASTTAISLCIAHFLTLFFWNKNLDPDSYTLPLQSALVDFLGQLLLMLAYELCIWQGIDVRVKVAT